LLRGLVRCIVTSSSGDKLRLQSSVLHSELVDAALSSLGLREQPLLQFATCLVMTDSCGGVLVLQSSVFGDQLINPCLAEGLLSLQPFDGPPRLDECRLGLRRNDGIRLQ
jgi:hypothetical protein